MVPDGPQSADGSREVDALFSSLSFG